MSWKQWIRRTKIETARVHLLSELYFAHPALVSGMRSVQRELASIATTQLTCDFDGVTLSLDAFAQKHVRWDVLVPI